jgi:hypothetical protein
MGLPLIITRIRDSRMNAPDSEGHNLQIEQHTLAATNRSSSSDAPSHDEISPDQPWSHTFQQDNVVGVLPRYVSERVRLDLECTANHVWTREHTNPPSIKVSRSDKITGTDAALQHTIARRENARGSPW